MEKYKSLMIKMKKIHIVRYILLSLLAFVLVNGCIENIIIRRKINAFISRGVFVEERVEPSTGMKTRYYAVSRETYDDDDRISYTRIDNNVYIGQRGDMIATKSSPFDNIPIFYQVVSFLFGGHAGMVSSTDTYLECVGNQLSNNCVRYNENDWFYVRNNAIGLRIKNASEDDYEQMVEKVEEKIGKPYNYTFVFNTSNTYYCTDLLSTSILEYNRDFYPNDTFVTTVNDLITSKNTYIFYYQCFDADNVMHVYYLE